MIHWIEYQLLRLSAFKLSFFPAKLDNLLFRVVWSFYRMGHQKEIQRVRSHLEQSPILPKPQITDVYRNLFINGLESLRWLYQRQSVEKRIHIVNRNLIQNLLNAGTPVVVVSIHSGAFEMLHRALGKLGRQVTLVASHHHHPAVDRWLRLIRSLPSLKIIRPDEAPKAIRSLIRRKGLLAIMVDQARSGKGHLVNLLGRPSYLWTRLPEEANQLGAAVVTFRAMRKGGAHVLKFETVYAPKTPVEELRRGLAMEFERWIVENPEQWAWNYPRLWQTQEKHSSKSRPPQRSRNRRPNDRRPRRPHKSNSQT